jgi:rhodanese-related sulfurtransferase
MSADSSTATGRVAPASTPQNGRAARQRAPIGIEPTEVLLDVRSVAEFQSARIPGSVNLPFEQLGDSLTELARGVTMPLVLICRSGSRARRAEALLREAGLCDVRVLDGGLLAWEAAGGPVVRARPRWALERQVRLVGGSLVLASSLAGLLLAPELAWLAVAVGAGLVFAAVTDSCAMGTLLARLPYNRSRGCDVQAAIRSCIS